jgi:signal peptidase I
VPEAEVPTLEDGAPRSPDGTGRQARRAEGTRKTRKVVIEWVLLIGGALLIAFLIKTFLFQAFYIPSESMTPTLKVNDRVLVNKLSYDLHDVNRGDIVVFEAPDDPSADGVKDLVKRVVGLPGETVEFRDERVFIDGEPLDESYLVAGPKGATTPSRNQFAEKCEPPAEDAKCVVPADSYLMLGDNRTESKDGRVFGPIPESDIVGRVFVRIWPLGDIGFL